MEEIDIHAKLAQIETAPHFSMIFDGDTEKAEMVAEHQLNDETFTEKVGAVSVKQLTRTAKERRSGSMGFAEAMILEYNGKKKSTAGKLFLNKLYARDIALWIEPDEDEALDDSDSFESLILGQFNNDENGNENNE